MNSLLSLISHTGPYNNIRFNAILITLCVCFCLIYMTVINKIDTSTACIALGGLAFGATTVQKQIETAKAAEDSNTNTNTEN